MKRVTGIGGVFFKAKDPNAMQAWYKLHLGIDVQAWGEAPPSTGLTQMASLRAGQRPGLSYLPRTTLLRQVRLPSW